jgi:hypothetical protein
LSIITLAFTWCEQQRGKKKGKPWIVSQGSDNYKGANTHDIEVPEKGN